MKQSLHSNSLYVQEIKNWHNFGNKRKGQLEHLVDRISELPDEILVSILSALSLKEAAATSILSKRWRHTWTSIMTLNFDANLHVGENYFPFRRLAIELQDQESRRYADWVSRVVEQHRGLNIERFRACFYLDCRLANSIDKWIQFAMTKGVQILELDFFIRDSLMYEAHYAFPSLDSFGYNIGFKSLKVLHFKHVDVSEEIVEYFLSNCPVLERLTVCASTKMVNLRVVGSSIPLKYLEITQCVGLKSIQIRDANIVSFTYYGDLISLLLSDVPFLNEVSIKEDDIENFHDCANVVFTQLSCVLSQLEIFMMDINPAFEAFNIFDPVQIYVNENQAFPTLANLKHLELILEADYQWVLHQLNFFMKASPYLQRLVLKLTISTFGRRRKIETAAKCPHHHLKVVEIVGYRARKCVVKQVMHLIKNSVVLEKIVVDPVQRWNWPNAKDMGNIEEMKEEMKARDHAMQHLKPKVPSTIEFVCLQ